MFKAKVEWYDHFAFGVEGTWREGVGIGIGLGRCDVWFGWLRKTTTENVAIPTLAD